jgi:type VI secretion system FHA domain protein
MILELLALRCPPPDHPSSFRAQFGPAGGHLGRGRDCTLPLPDISLQISRKHAEIRYRNGEFSLKVKSANGVIINDTFVAEGVGMALVEGDRVAIGDYLFEVRIAKSANPLPSPFDALGPTDGAQSPRSASPASRLGTLPAALAVERRIDESLPTGKLSAVLGRGVGHATPAAEAVVTHPTLSEGDIGKLLEGLVSISGTPSTDSRGGLESWHPEAETGSLSHVEGHATDMASPSGDIFDALQEFAPQEHRREKSPPLQVTTPSAEAPEPLSASSVPMEQRRQAERVPDAPKPMRRVDDQGDNAALMRTLNQALGLPPGTLDDGQLEATLQLVGDLLRLSVGGLHKMLAMRSELRGQLGVEDRTTIKSRDNNPLKQTDSPEDALAYLVDVRQHKNKLFMLPTKAVEDAVWDLCAHEMALMAGTQEALRASLKLFSPQVLEGRITTSGALDKVLPSMRKSRLWDLFLQMYGALEREAEDHFDRLLKDEFVRAYGEQSKKLRKRKLKTPEEPLSKSGLDST